MFNLKYFKIKNLTSIFRTIPKFNFKLLITLISLIFIGSSIYTNFEDLSSQIITIKEILWLFWATFFSISSIVINAFAWKLLINSIGCDTSKLNIVKIFINTNIYKYLPGGIWHFVSRFKTLRIQYSNDKSIESILLEPLLMLVAGLIFVPFGSFNLLILTLCWSSTLCFLTDFRVFIVKNLKKIKANIFINKDQLNDIKVVQYNQNIPIKSFYPFRALLVEIIFILFRFLGFLCCLKAFSVGSLISQGALISSFSLAWIIGLIVPAAPGGLGVFESVILFNLSLQLPEAPLLASLLCYRMVSTLSDILVALIYPAVRLLKV